jgi:hypothetical protein
MKTAEQSLNDQLAACLAGVEDCLAQSRRPRDDDPHGHQRRAELAYVAKLMKASARLTEALAKLKGETRQEIFVVRGDAARGKVTRRSVDKAQGDKGEG